jgi:hypothetical protein
MLGKNLSILRNQKEMSKPNQPIENKASYFNSIKLSDEVARSIDNLTDMEDIRWVFENGELLLDRLHSIEEEKK